VAIGRIDRVPAVSPFEIAWEDRESVWHLDVRGEYGMPIGKISIRTRGDLATGRLTPQTLRIGS
jgi:hypothetical protein